LCSLFPRVLLVSWLGRSFTGASMLVNFERLLPLSWGVILSGERLFKEWVGSRNFSGGNNQWSGYLWLWSLCQHIIQKLLTHQVLSVGATEGSGRKTMSLQILSVGMSSSLAFFLILPLVLAVRLALICCLEITSDGEDFSACRSVSKRICYAF
jgi:hypothetical protein